MVQYKIKLQEKAQLSAKAFLNGIYNLRKIIKILWLYTFFKIQIFTSYACHIFFHLQKQKNKEYPQYKLLL